MSLPSIEALTIGNFLSACTAALTKKDMKPRRTPCSFSKRSWYFFLSSITGAMLTSLNVVRIAAVDCDCTRRSAMRCRNRDMGTRCSPREPGWGIEARGARAACAGADVGVDAPITSPFVTRPSRPLPCTVEVSIPFSAAILAAYGDAAGGWGWVVIVGGGGGFSGPLYLGEGLSHCAYRPLWSG